MTINATNNYYTKLKSYFISEATESIFNRPIVRGTVIATTVLVTGIAAAYFVKKAQESIRAICNRPLESALITATIFATGVVVVNYPITSMIAFGAASCILLNKSLFAKIDNANKIALAIFNAQSLKAIRNLGLNSYPKAVEDVNSDNNPSTTTSKDLNLTDLKLGDLKGIKGLKPTDDLVDPADLDDDLKTTENINLNNNLSTTTLQNLNLTSLIQLKGGFKATKNLNPTNDPSTTTLQNLNLTNLIKLNGGFEATKNLNLNSNLSIAFPQPYKFLQSITTHKLPLTSTVSPTTYKKVPLTSTVFPNAYKFVKTVQRMVHLMR